MIGEHTVSFVCIAVFITLCLIAVFVGKVRVCKLRFHTTLEKDPRQAVGDIQEVGMAATSSEIESLGHTLPRSGNILNRSY
ncbi:hypothetical protein CHS0354_020341 [Potamilus streckersoni]|uniref:Uncharacterized protein n=1 Tax=Potamilus streckersoni TaxID=2493646 RepID=A0AAE0VVR9_9BIVA|nr:hypothetical protein CHS0354_020341 [Potamilus streckersoni]